MLKLVQNILLPHNSAWSPREVARRRLFVNILVLCIIIAILELGLRSSFYRETPMWLVPFFTIFIATLISLFLARTAKSITRISQFFLFVLTVFLSFYLFGNGLASGATPLLFYALLVTALVLGPRHALACAAYILGVFVWTYLKFHAPGMESPKQIDFAFLLLGSLTTVGICFASWIYNREMTSAVEALKRERQLALAASRAKSDFLANMSHEIRTPMNGVLGMTELLQSTALDEKQKVFAETIYSSGNALLTIINDILDFSKIEAGKLELDPTPFNLEGAVDDIAALLGVPARQKNLELMVRHRPNLPAGVIGDVGRFRQLLTNLVGNALKFTHAGSVLIDVQCKDIKEGIADIKIDVVDTGIGIAEEKFERIFEQFTQAEESTTRTFGGTGLGLSITKSLVEAMGGSISATSKLGYGSTFTIELALPVDEGRISQKKSKPLKLDNIEILIVDDNEVNRSILDELVRSWGGTPVIAEGGAEALSLLRDRKAAGAQIPIALLDYHMPEMNGLTLARSIRRDPAFSDTQMIILSSVDSEALMSSFREVGVADIMTKPVRGAMLRDLVARRLGALPAAPAEHNRSRSPANDSPADEKINSVNGLSILVAEDNEVNRQVVFSMLNKPERDISFAENGKIAFEMAKKSRFDLIFMDISMPVMDGVESATAIRSFEVASERDPTPIIALTAHAIAGDRDRFLEGDIDDYIGKPVRIDDLETMIEKWVKRVKA